MLIGLSLVVSLLSSWLDELVDSLEVFVCRQFPMEIGHCGVSAIGGGYPAISLYCALEELVNPISFDFTFTSIPFPPLLSYNAISYLRLVQSLAKRSSGIANASFTDDEDTTQIPGSLPATRGRRGSSTGNTSRGRAKAPTRGRGRGKDEASHSRLVFASLKGNFLSSRFNSLGPASASFKSASTIEEDDVDSPSSDEAEPEDVNSSPENENTKGKGRKRQATTRRGRGSRGSGASKRDRKTKALPHLIGCYSVAKTITRTT
ncbi:unnamed protein product [Arabis nemorensis]|uniref:Uncharacterized protein n=1 Tax=Arabis nemorensis TaxID=586526 RepID=A0A565CQV4_9BRAS|nr:unnamed protein product [Arabis nemorensis]